MWGVRPRPPPLTLARSFFESIGTSWTPVLRDRRGIMNDADQLFQRTQHVKLLLCSILLAALLLPAQAADCPIHQGREAGVLTQIEQSWAAALELRDADAVGCILADEFQDVDPSGALHDRNETLAQIPHRRPGKNILSELTPHVFGDFGYIRGLATLVDAQGNTIARVRFTDIYVYRDHRWLAVAGQESLLPAAK